ncbi:Na+/H+ antiporter subunit E [Ilumatobacter sp.]|uniref:Na+/H+ antiporter subunit E n=1 Tax=Ilumatobacter sp. TaxID=1967498 RepID=UPI003C5BB86C
MRQALRIPAIMLWLTILWVFLWGEVSWANVLGGIAVATAVVLFARLEKASLRPTHFHPGWAVFYAISLLWQLLLSNIRLAVEILTPSDGTHTAIIAVPIRGGSEAVINLVANSITLTPGTMTVDVWAHERDELDIDGDGIIDEMTAGATLYVHCIYGQDVEAVRHQVLRLEELALRAFGSERDHELAHADVVEHATLLESAARAERLRRDNP